MLIHEIFNIWPTDWSYAQLVSCTDLMRHARIVRCPRSWFFPNILPVAGKYSQCIIKILHSTGRAVIAYCLELLRVHKDTASKMFYNDMQHYETLLLWYLYPIFFYWFALCLVTVMYSLSWRCKIKLGMIRKIHIECSISSITENGNNIQFIFLARRINIFEFVKSHTTCRINYCFQFPGELF